MTNGSASQYAWERFLAFHKIDTKEVTFLNVQPPEMVTLMDRGDIDAFALWEPFPMRALETMGNKARILARGMDNNIYTAILNVVVSKAFAGKNPEAVERLLKSLAEANEFIKSNPDKAAALVAETVKWDAKGVSQLIKENNYEIVLLPATLKDLSDTAAWLAKANRIKAVPDMKKVVVPDYLKKVNPAGVKLAD